MGGDDKSTKRIGRDCPQINTDERRRTGVSSQPRSGGTPVARGGSYSTPTPRFAIEKPLSGAPAGRHSGYVRPSRENAGKFSTADFTSANRFAFRRAIRFRVPPLPGLRRSL